MKGFGQGVEGDGGEIFLYIKEHLGKIAFSRNTFFSIVNLDRMAESAQQQSEKQVHPAGDTGVGINICVITFHKYILNGIFHIRIICSCGKQHIIGAFGVGIQDIAKERCHKILLSQKLKKGPFKGALPDHQGHGNGIIIKGHIVPGARGDHTNIPGGQAFSFVFKNHIAGAGKNVVDLKEIVGVHTFGNTSHIGNRIGIHIFGMIFSAGICFPLSSAGENGSRRKSLVTGRFKST